MSFVGVYLPPHRRGRVKTTWEDRVLLAKSFGVNGTVSLAEARNAIGKFRLPPDWRAVVANDNARPERGAA